MRMVQLTKQEKENILENLLKRSPNQYVSIRKQSMNFGKCKKRRRQGGL